MGSFNIWHWVVVIVVMLLLFGGRGKISALLADFGQGIKSFKRVMHDDESAGTALIRSDSKGPIDTPIEAAGSRNPMA
jgi:sec-independent protein translocase protein TatA